MMPLVREWIAKADEDYEVAQREMRVRKSPALNAICFHAQQCAEKYFKARLCANGGGVIRTHDLTALLNELVKSDPTLELLHPAAHALMHYGVRFRYPGASATRPEARTALSHAKLIRETLRRTFGLPAGTTAKGAQTRTVSSGRRKPRKRNGRR